MNKAVSCLIIINKLDCKLRIFVAPETDTLLNCTDRV